MADKKISQLTNLTGANLAENDEFVLVDTSADETKAITFGELKTAFDTGTGFVRVTGDTMTGDLSFNGGDTIYGDNDKAIFGAGSDLQIYHDSATNHSIIAESGSGSLFLRGQAITMQNADGSAAYFGGNGSVATAYYGTSAKLATTATGIDVTGTVIADSANITGTVTADGLTVTGTGVDPSVVISNTTNGDVSLTLRRVAANDAFTDWTHMNDGGRYKLISDDTVTNDALRMQVDYNGDISFYEDTGTTPKFHWSASSESLGIGTSSPDTILHTFGTSATVYDPASVGGQNTSATLKIHNQSNAANTFASIDFSTNIGRVVNRIVSGHASSTSSGFLGFVTEDAGVPAERMRIDSSGNVGIGTSSPLRSLHISSAGDTGLMLQTTNANTDAEIWEIQSAADGSNNANLIFRSRTNTGTGGSEAMRIDSSGNVGIGTSSPIAKLQIKTQTNGNASFQNSTSVTGGVKINAFNDAGNASVPFEIDGSSLQFNIASVEKMRIDSSGNLLVAKTATGINTAGIELRGDKASYFTRDSGIVMLINRLTSDGDIVSFRKNGSTVGSIGANNGDLTIGDGDAGLKYSSASNQIYPWNMSTQAVNDNFLDMGTATGRFDDIYATNGTIQTSDRNEKQDIEVLSDAEQRVAVACKGLLRKFRWKDAVAEKGDNARIHFGIIAQDLQDAFSAEGLDAGRYAMFISSTWWEATETYTDDEGVEQTRTNTYETLEEAPEDATERTRLGVRYPELLAFIIAAI